MLLISDNLAWWYALWVLVVACFVILLKLWLDFKRKKEKISLMASRHPFRFYVLFGLLLCPLVLFLVSRELWSGFYRMKMTDAQTLRLTYAAPMPARDVAMGDIQKILFKKKVYFTGAQKIDRQSHVTIQMRILLRNGRKFKSMIIRDPKVVDSLMAGFRRLRVPMEMI